MRKVGKILESRTKQGRMPWRRPIYRINFDILAASQELNYYGSVSVMWVVHQKVKNEMLLFAIARMVYTVLWVWARSWAVKFIVGGD